MLKNTGINIAIFDNKDFVSSMSGILKELNADNLELPVQLCHRLELKELFLDSLSISGLSGLLNETDIFPMSIFVSEKLFKEQIESFQSKLEMANKLNCQNMSLGVDPFVDYDNLKYAEELFIDRVRYCANLSGQMNVNINLEYISHNVVSNGWKKGKFLFCDSINKTINLIDKIGLSNVNLLLDFLHWYCDEQKPIFKEFCSYIGFVHICDNKEKDLRKITDNSRVLPGEGILPIEPFINCLKRFDYKGPSTIEVFRNDEYSPSISEINKSLYYISSLWSKEL